MTSDLGEDTPALPLHKEFGIFCVGWVGAVCATFLLALAGFDGGDQTFREFLYECMRTSIMFLAIGVFAFVGLMILVPSLVEAIRVMFNRPENG